MRHASTAVVGGGTDGNPQPRRIIPSGIVENRRRLIPLRRRWAGGRPPRTAAQVHETFTRARARAGRVAFANFPAVHDMRVPTRDRVGFVLRGRNPAGEASPTRSLPPTNGPTFDGRGRAPAHVILGQLTRRPAVHIARSLRGAGVRASHDSQRRATTRCIAVIPWPPKLPFLQVFGTIAGTNRIQLGNPHAGVGLYPPAAAFITAGRVKTVETCRVRNPGRAPV
jgi:hypothetical protein